MKSRYLRIFAAAIVSVETGMLKRPYVVDELKDAAKAQNSQI